jgi:hypothetical protein
MDLEKKKKDLLQAEERLKAQLNYVIGQLALCEEILAPQNEEKKESLEIGE